MPKDEAALRWVQIVQCRDERPRVTPRLARRVEQPEDHPYAVSPWVVPAEDRMFPEVVEPGGVLRGELPGCPAADQREQPVEPDLARIVAFRYRLLDQRKCRRRHASVEVVDPDPVLFFGGSVRSDDVGVHVTVNCVCLESNGRPTARGVRRARVRGSHAMPLAADMMAASFVPNSARSPMSPDSRLTATMSCLLCLSRAAVVAIPSSSSAAWWVSSSTRPAR